MRQAPDTLTPEGKKIWKELVNSFDFLPNEFQTLKVGLECLDEISMCKALLKKHGFFIQDKDGKVRPHPATDVLKESRQGFLRAWKALGFKTDTHRGPGRPSNPDFNKIEYSRWGDGTIKK